ncbi:MAG TPA: thioredoxin domain-containing protein, partial [Chitinophagaceae bacterium]|nr:thioredoxin domain-containing protein [Chitinophagaceae bacterium]
MIVKSNHLAQETSPYLLQHAHNPVDWYPWGSAALQKAKDQNKPILISIGYAACHWCHVMERESFEDEDTAAIMNEHFVNIKIDREERPDLDHIYMDAVQAMTGSGGWPLNVFLTPDRKPFYGGTYFPPRRAFNRPSWKEVLLSIAEAYRERKPELIQQAENLTQHLFQSNQFGLGNQTSNSIFSSTSLEEIYANLMKNADEQHGGFGNAPKFPQTFSIQWLLRHYHYSKNQRALDHGLFSLDKMILGGIYDQVGGGFARYATDAEWLVPHFEKMLYDNALLLVCISEAFQLTGKEFYKEIIEETIAFVKRELTSPSNGFYCALDADSEGEEGKYYVWTRQEVTEVVGADAELFCTYFDITEKGNWEGQNILHASLPLPEFSKEKGIDAGKAKAIFQSAKEKLLEARSHRPRPLLDDKILLGWNALMNAACSKAFMATGNEDYRNLAIQNMEFMMNSFKNQESGDWNHSYKNGEARFPAFLDDIAFLIQALILLQEITGDPQYLHVGKELTEYVIAHFSEEDGPFFYYTRQGQEDVIVRKKEIYDGATPSGNAVMAHNLFYLSVVFDIRNWKARSMEMVSSLEQVIKKYPGSFAMWASLLQGFTKDVPEIVLTGKKINELRNQF